MESEAFAHAVTHADVAATFVNVVFASSQQAALPATKRKYGVARFRMQFF
jgi:hypothetical protein